MRTRALVTAAVLMSLVLIGCGGSDSTPTSPTQPTTGSGSGGSADITITIVGMNGSSSYSPNPGTLKVGQKVAWRNADSVPHTATANGGSFDTGAIGPGATSSAVTVTAAGTFDYHCSFHPSMVGTLTVTQ